MIRINQVINGSYMVLREIGKGGTGVVYLAWHVNLRKYVVLKRIQAYFGDEASLRKEADILKNLHHTNLPQIYDFVVDGEDVFTVMDYIEGTPLDRMACGANQIPEKLLLSWFVRLSEVLIYLHSRSPAVIHSDIKPGNVILTPQGEPVLIDFNISLAENAAGKVIGYSPHFASPEQAALSMLMRTGQTGNYALDERTDLYSLGATFYYLASGIMPSCTHPLPRLSDTPGLIYSQAFRSVIDTCVSYDRGRRYASAKKLHAALVNLRKQDVRYRRYTILRAVSWIGSALMVAGGIYCLLRGVQEESREAYRAQYEQLAQAVEAGDGRAVLERADEILNSAGHEKILRDNPDQHAMILRAVGDVQYAEGAFAEAAQSYEDALAYTEKDSPLRESCYGDLATALAGAGDAEGEEEVLRMAREDGVESDVLTLIEAGVEAGNQDYARCYALVDALLAGKADAEMKARAGRVAADAAAGQGDADRQIQYLEQVLAGSRDSSDRRKLAEALLYRSDQGDLSEAEQEEYTEQALAQYKVLCEARDPSVTDQINCAATYYRLGENQNCIRMLDHISEANSTDYRIDMYRALALDKMQQRDAALAACERALDACAEQEGSASDQNLLQELRARLL